MTESTQSPTPASSSRRDPASYDAVVLPDDEVVVYDSAAHTRWVQSDAAIPVSECR